MKYQKIPSLSGCIRPLGRTLPDREEGILWCDWSLAGVEVCFHGSTLLAEFCALPGEETERNPRTGQPSRRPTWPWCTVVVDDRDVPSAVFEVQGEHCVRLVFHGQTPGPHRIRLVKRTENGKGFLGLRGFWTEGELLPVPAHCGKKQIVFIGDSITCGFGNSTTDQSRPFFSAEEDGWLAHGGVAARLLGYEPALICSSGVGAYTLSGDNYPHRIPLYNDAERMRIFRTGGIRGMMKAGVYTEARGRELRGLWQRDEDADPNAARNRPWLAAYQAAGRAALAEYLGTDREQDYEELSGIAARFHRGESKIWLKRMGRTEDALWYDQVDFSRVQVLLIEWTHSSNDRLRGVDLPVLLNSTPEETRLYRRARNRDGRVDSPFTTMVLEIEQKELHRSAHKAGLILSKDGQLLSYEEYCALMNDQL